MMVRWRQLLDHLGVQWTDSSRYAGRSWIAVACPWCGAADLGFHLGISENHGGYRCLRNDQHRGRSPYWLLQALGVRHAEMDSLLTSFGGTTREAYREQPLSERPPADQNWRRLHPAADDPKAVDYLARRHFIDPQHTATEFDLRVGQGRWSGRIWFKFCGLDGQITGMTGRAIDDQWLPRYYTEASPLGLYMPRLPTAQHRLALLVEGPVDALRIAEVTRRRSNLLVMALGGLSLTAHKRMQLVEIARTTPRFAVALDRTVWAVEANRLIDELRIVPALNRITRLPMPMGIDDPGEMTNHQIEQWLGTM